MFTKLCRQVLRHILDLSIGYGSCSSFSPCPVASIVWTIYKWQKIHGRSLHIAHWTRTDVHTPRTISLYLEAPLPIVSTMLRRSYDLLQCSFPEGL